MANLQPRLNDRQFTFNVDEYFGHRMAYAMHVAGLRSAFNQIGWAARGIRFDFRNSMVAADNIFTRLRIWARKAINTALDRAYRPGGPGYLRARANFMVNAGQRRRTRRFKPY